MTRKLLYIANARMPTEKAHGIAIMKACQAFVREGVEVTLVVPQRRNHLKNDPFELYGIRERFPIVHLFTIDLYSYEKMFGRACFIVQALTFYKVLFWWLLFQSRSQIVYTRDAPVVAIARLLGFRVFLECHAAQGRSLYYRCAHLAHGMVTTARAIALKFVSRGFDSERVFVVPNAVDLDVFDIAVDCAEARARLGIAPDSFLMVYTGNFTTYGEDKGITDILHALRNLPSDVHMIAVGGSEGDCTRYASLAHDLDVMDRVTFIGYQTQPTLALYQKAADVLMMPFPDTPHYRSNMSPIKMFEYMASKCPIIASDLPTIREILDETTALIIPPNSPEEMAAAVKTVQSNPVEGERKADAAYERVKQFTWQYRAKKILAFIAS